MRILTNLISPLTLLSVFIAGILASNQYSNGNTAKTNQKKG